MAYKQGKNPFSKNPLNFNSPLNSFDSLVGKLMNQGKSKEAATKIAGKVANMKMKGAGSGPTAAQKARAKGSAAKMEESPLDKELVGNQHRLPEELKAKIEAAPESPAKMKSPVKAHDKALKALEKRIKRVRQSKEGSEGQGGIDYELLAQLEEQKKKLIESHGKEAKQTAKPSPANLEEGDDSEAKTEKLDEVVVTAKKDRSREAIKNRKAKMKRDGKSKREIRLAKTKDKVQAAKKATVDAKDKDSQKLARAKANRLAKRVARQEGRAERRENRKSKKFRENKRQAAIKSRRQQKEKGEAGASALAMKSPVKKEQPHSVYADQGLIKSYKKGDKYIAIDGSSHDNPQSERQASGRALTKAKAKARANRGKSSPAKMKSPGGKRNPYTNSPMGDLSGEKVYGPATAAIAAGKKVVKKINKVRANAISTKNKLKHKAKKGVRKAVKAVKEFSKDIQERGT